MTVTASAFQTSLCDSLDLPCISKCTDSIIHTEKKWTLSNRDALK